MIKDLPEVPRQDLDALQGFAAPAQVVLVDGLGPGVAAKGHVEATGAIEAVEAVVAVAVEPEDAGGAIDQSPDSAGMENRSRGVGPQSTASARAASAAVRVIGPMCSSDSQLEMPGWRSSRQPG